MKNIFRFFLLTVAAALVVVACRDDADKNWTKQEASLLLHDPHFEQNTLYPSMAQNPFVLSWEDGGAGNYSIVLSVDENFGTTVELGQSNGTSMETTVGALNLALLQAGVDPYKATPVFIRVEANGGSTVSNPISIVVATYPATGPVITSPLAGAALILDSSIPQDIAATVNWQDYAEYGVDVTYNIEIALHGEDAFQQAGTTTNLRTFDWTHQFLNDAVLKTGAVPGEETDIDIKVTALSSSVGGELSNSSDLVTVKITPFVSFINLFLVGDATAADWDNSANNADMYPVLNNHSNSNLYSFTGYFWAGGFKLVKTKGNWDDQYGLGDSAGTLSTSGGSGNIPIPSDGFYHLELNTTTMTYTLEPVTIPFNSPYTTIGIIGSGTSTGWDSDTDMTQSYFDPHQWYILNVTLTDGEMKFRAENDWAVSWGSTEENFGTATSDGGPNIPVAAGTYDIYFNDYTGAYSLIKKD